MEDNNPKGAGWLFHSKALQMYLNLLSSSERDATLEASCGALQNLTANDGIVRLWLICLFSNLIWLICVHLFMGWIQIKRDFIIFYIFYILFILMHLFMGWTQSKSGNVFYFIMTIIVIKYFLY